MTDETSDLDLNAFVSDQPPAAETRRRIYAKLSEQGAVSVDDEIWGRHDDFRTPDGLLVDIAWWTVDWFESQLRPTVEDCRPLPGYSTVWWHQLLNATPVADPTGWYSHLVPIVLGSGVRLLDGLEPGSVGLELVRVDNAPGVTHLTYRVVK